MTPEQHELVTTHFAEALRTPRLMLRNAERSHAEEARSWALEGLVAAAIAYDPALQVPFRAFAIGMMRWQVLRGLRGERRHRARVDLGEVDVERTAQGMARSAAARTVEDELVDRHEARARQELVRELCADLPPKERAVIQAHYYEDTELRHIAAAHDASYATIRRRHRVGLRLLGARLVGAGMRGRGIGARGQAGPRRAEIL